jgi:hypothetical protein
LSRRRERLGKDSTKVTPQTLAVGIITLIDRLRTGNSTTRTPVLISKDRMETGREFVTVTGLGIEHESATLTS